MLISQKNMYQRKVFKSSSICHCSLVQHRMNQLFTYDQGFSWADFNSAFAWWSWGFKFYGHLPVLYSCSFLRWNLTRVDKSLCSWIAGKVGRSYMTGFFFCVRVVLLISWFNQFFVQYIYTVLEVVLRWNTWYYIYNFSKEEQLSGSSCLHEGRPGSPNGPWRVETGSGGLNKTSGGPNGDGGLLKAGGFNL